MSIIVATTINYFNTTHHTGQRAVSHFIQKVLTTLFSDIGNEVSEDDLKNTAHRIGHWASTTCVSVSSTSGLGGASPLSRAQSGSAQLQEHSPQISWSGRTPCPREWPHMELSMRVSPNMG